MGTSSKLATVIAVRDDPGNPKALPSGIFEQDCGACGERLVDVVFQDDGQAVGKGYGVCGPCADKMLELVVN